jgi:hypothetical protein
MMNDHDVGQVPTATMQIVKPSTRQASSQTVMIQRVLYWYPDVPRRILSSVTCCTAWWKQGGTCRGFPDLHLLRRLAD